MNRSAKALALGARLGGADDLDFFRPEYLVERTRELRVAVVQDEPDRGEPLGDG